MDDRTLIRYSRQMLLSEMDEAAQQGLADARVAVVGLGGLGSPAAAYLAGAGIGELTLVDPDPVELSNLHRQPFYQSADLGHPKTECLARHLQALNPTIRIRTMTRRADLEGLGAIAAANHVVVDATDNAASREALNRACQAASRPWVSGAALRGEGSLTVFDPRRPDSPCYACLHGEGGDTIDACSQSGVWGPLPGVVGSLQAMEVIKLLTDCGEVLCGQVLNLDIERGEWSRLRLRRRPDCPVCQPAHPPSEGG